MANIYEISDAYTQAVQEDDEMKKFKCRLALIHIEELERVQYALEKYRVKPAEA